MKFLHFLIFFAILFSGCVPQAFEADLQPVDPAACTQVVDALRQCYDGYCETEDASAAFCSCWAQGQDINVDNCKCRTFNAQDEICRAYEYGGFSAADVDCNDAIDSFLDECGSSAETKQ